LKEFIMTTLTSLHVETGEARRGAGSGWGWIVALGAALIAFGVLAFFNLPTATAVSVYAVGIYMIIAAGVQAAGAIAARSWGGFALMLLSAILYGVAGAMTIMNPVLAATALTLMLALALIFSGATRIAWSLALRGLPGWGWITASGVVSILAGIVFIAGWPADSVFLLGVVLAVDLTFQGAMLTGLGFALRGLAKA
jgi:uncharacterized membrane protein HdeD (DUF308 family)